MDLFRFIFLAGLILITSVVQGGVDAIRLKSCLFQQLFHNITVNEANVTTLRKELKVKVSEQDSDQFLKTIEEAVGANRVSLRDVPENPDEVFITNTDYLTPFKGVDEKGEEVFSGKIRIRNYFMVSKGTHVKDLKNVKNPRYSKIADGPSGVIFAKLEFKIGHPEKNTASEVADAPGVVDKPGIVLARKDIDLLLESWGSFLQNRQAVYTRGVGLKLTQKSGKSDYVNNPKELEALLQRIEKMHQYIHLGLLSGESAGDFSPASRIISKSVLTQPVANIRYQRTARKIQFHYPKPFEVQVTMDEGVRVTDFTEKKAFSNDPHHRVIELKIPTEYADRTDAELEAMGLVDLVKIRKAFTALTPVPGSMRGRGKLGPGLTHIRDGRGESAEERTRVFESEF